METGKPTDHFSLYNTTMQTFTAAKLIFFYPGLQEILKRKCLNIFANFTYNTDSLKRTKHLEVAHCTLFLPIRILRIKPFLVCFLEMDNINVCLVNSFYIPLSGVYAHWCSSVNSCNSDPIK